MLNRAKHFIRKEAQALEILADRIDRRVCAAARAILSSSGAVIVTGVGKSQIVGEKISATLASTGTPSITLDPTGAMHGDLGRLRPDDILLCLSNSGETMEMNNLVAAAKRLGVKVISITGNQSSSLAELSDIVLDIGHIIEACPLGLAPTTTTTAMMALGDALALLLLEQRGFTREDFARYHPAGSLGQGLTQVEELMRKGDRLPIVVPGTPLKSALVTMYATPGRPGAVLVAEQRVRLCGIFTHQDLQRVVLQGSHVFADPVDESMRPCPRTVQQSWLVQDTLKVFKESRTEHLPVVDDLCQVVGLLAAFDIAGFPATPRPPETGPRLSMVS